MCSGGGTGDVYEKLLFWRVSHLSIHTGQKRYNRFY
jgi:hypothetical protein